MQQSEVILSGGHLTPVVRVGDHVRRAAGSWTPAVHVLLRHLQNVGLSVAPKPLAFDLEAGVELLSYLEGEVPSGGSTPYLWHDDMLAAVARLVRQFHDATADFRPPADTQWQVLAAHPGGGEILCHNDLAPWNTVFRKERPVAFIDWDLAAPGPRLWDVAFAIWHFVPLYGDQDVDPFGSASLGPRGQRVRLFCDAYGLDDRRGLLDMLRQRELATYAGFSDRAAAGDPPYVRLWQLGAGEGILRQIAFLDRHRKEIELCLA